MEGLRQRLRVGLSVRSKSEAEGMTENGTKRVRGADGLGFSVIHVVLL